MGICLCEETNLCTTSDDDGALKNMYLRRSDSSISLLASCVPDLSLDGLAFHLDASCGKLYPDGALALQVELIPSEAGQQVTFPNP